MLLRRFTDFILQNRLQAMGIAFILAFIPLIGTISIIIAAFVTLRRGVFEGALVLFAATAPDVIGYIVYPATNQNIFTIDAFIIVIVSNILTWLFAVILRRYRRWNVTLEFTALVGILFISGVHVFYPDIQNWWQVQLHNAFTQAAAETGKLNAQEAIGNASAEVATIAKHYATGFATTSVLFNALLQLLLARWWQAIIFNPGGLRQELYQIRLSQVAAVTFVTGLILTYLGNDLVLDIMPVLYFVFIVAGLSLIHSLVALTKLGWLWLLLVYLAIICLFPLSAVIVSVIALLDALVDVRKQLI